MNKVLPQWDRHYLISRTSIDSIRSELNHLKQSLISTPDSEASYQNIIDILDRLRGV